MVETYPETDLHLVDDLAAALEIAQALRCEAVAFDMEGVLGNYVGNKPYDGYLEDFLQGDGRANMSRAQGVILDRSDVAFGIVTNNTNQPSSEANADGLVTQVASRLDIPFAHKGMLVGGVALRAKPSGDQSEHFCEKVGVYPERTVLIDDQGVKNAGEAVRAGLMAIIVPHPIGLPRPGRPNTVVEHKWVGRGRRFEPQIYASLERQGWLAKLAYGRLAKIDPDLIGSVHNHRQPNR